MVTVLTSAGAVSSIGSLPNVDRFIDRFESLTKVPLLTCFIPSLAPGTPFRISIHSWTKPQASGILRERLAIDEDANFQARLYVDGVRHSTRMLYENTMWPEVIENSDLPHQKASSELRFPPFHPEILHQAHWDAGEQLGRIKIIISEGIMRANSPLMPQSVEFDRLRDVAAFSFQHAPQGVLEYSGIAWPNPRMFEIVQRDPRRLGPIGTRMVSSHGYDPHGHSPQRSASGNLGRCIPGIQPSNGSPSQSFATRSFYASGNGLTSQSTGLRPTIALSKDDDPFMGPSSAGQTWKSKTRSRNTDDSMPDYELDDSLHTRTSTEMSGVDWPQRDFQRHMDEAAIDEIVQALSPEKKEQLMEALSPAKSSNSGLQPPANTPKTAETSKEASPVLNQSVSLSEDAAVKPKQVIDIGRSVSDDSGLSSSSESGRQTSGGSGRLGSRIFDSLIATRSTRSQRSKKEVQKSDLDVRPATNRQRSVSDTAKRRKISWSPPSHADTTPKIVQKVSLTKERATKKSNKSWEMRPKLTACR